MRFLGDVISIRCDVEIEFDSPISCCRNDDGLLSLHISKSGNAGVPCCDAPFYGLCRAISNEFLSYGWKD